MMGIICPAIFMPLPSLSLFKFSPGSRCTATRPGQLDLLENDAFDAKLMGSKTIGPSSGNVLVEQDARLGASNCANVRTIAQIFAIMPDQVKASVGTGAAALQGGSSKCDERSAGPEQRPHRPW
jgi:hypothetical protein